MGPFEIHSIDESKKTVHAFDTNQIYRKGSGYTQMQIFSAANSIINQKRGLSPPKFNRAELKRVQKALK